MPRTQARSQVIIFLGPPGSGKGTQAARLSRELEIPAISTGEMLRREAQSGSALGEKVKSVLASGQLVSDRLVNEVVASRLKNCDCDSGCILDGYPRTLSQARFLSNLLARLSKREPVIFDFKISPSEIVERISRRRLCTACGRIFGMEAETDSANSVCDRDGSPLVQRADDRPQVVRERLRQYERNSAKLVRYYRTQHFYSIDAARSPEQISNELLNLLTANGPVPNVSRAIATMTPATLHA